MLITTVILESEENPWGPPERNCQEQIQEPKNLKYYRKYMEEKCSSSSCYNSRSEHLQSCCKQLKKLDRQRASPGLKQAVRQQIQEGQMGAEEMQEVYQMAENIMNESEIEPRRCEMSSSRTTITLDNKKSTRKQQESRCQRQIKKQDYLKNCQRCMVKKSSSSYDNPSQQLDSCCEQLEKMDKQCRCPGLQQAVQQQMQEGLMGRHEMQKMYQAAEQMMYKCEMEPGR